MPCARHHVSTWNASCHLMMSTELCKHFSVHPRQTNSTRGLLPVSRILHHKESGPQAPLLFITPPWTISSPLISSHWCVQQHLYLSGRPKPNGFLSHSLSHFPYLTYHQVLQDLSPKLGLLALQDAYECHGDLVKCRFWVCRLGACAILNCSQASRWCRVVDPGTSLSNKVSSNSTIAHLPPVLGDCLDYARGSETLICGWDQGNKSQHASFFSCCSVNNYLYSPLSFFPLKLIKL